MKQQDSHPERLGPCCVDFIGNQPVSPPENVTLVESDNRIGDIIKGLAAASTGIEEARDLGVIQKPQIKLGDVADVDKIPALFAVSVAIAAFKKR